MSVKLGSLVFRRDGSCRLAKLGASETSGGISHREPEKTWCPFIRDLVGIVKKQEGGAGCCAALPNAALGEQEEGREEEDRSTAEADIDRQEEMPDDMARARGLWDVLTLEWARPEPEQMRLGHWMLTGNGGMLRRQDPKAIFRETCKLRLFCPSEVHF